MRAANKKQKPKTDERGRRLDAAKRAKRLARLQEAAMPAVAPLTGPKKERVVSAELVDPSPHGGLGEVLGEHYLLRLIVRRMLASMYAASLLGLLWSYIQPAMRFLIYYAVMGWVLEMHHGQPAYAIHLFVGIVFLHFFSESWNGSTRSIFQNRQLVLKMRMPREIFPVAAITVAAYHTLPQLALLTIICLLSGWHITVAGVFAALLGLGIIVSYVGAIALVFSALNVFYRDFQNIVQTLLQFMHFMVPMMYPFSKVWAIAQTRPWLYDIYMCNPLAEVVLLMQRFFWWGVAPVSAEKPGGMLQWNGVVSREFPPDLWSRGLLMLLVGLVMVFYAQRFFTRVEDKFPERL